MYEATTLDVHFSDSSACPNSRYIIVHRIVWLSWRNGRDDPAWSHNGFRGTDIARGDDLLLGDEGEDGERGKKESKASSTLFISTLPDRMKAMGVLFTCWMWMFMVR